MQKRIKVAALSLIAVVIAAAIMLIPTSAASATVYQDNNVTIPAITSTIYHEDMGAYNSAQAVNISMWYADVSNFDDLFLDIYMGSDFIGGLSVHFNVNYNTSTINAVYALSPDGINISTFNLSANIIETAQRFSIGVRITNNTISFYSTINNDSVTGIMTGITVSDYTEHKYISLYYDLFNPNYVDISLFSGSENSLGYGLISYPSYQTQYLLYNQGTYSDGYSDGYSTGADHWNSFVGWDWLRAAISIVGTVLTIEIAPNIYLGYFVALPLILGAVMFVLQFKR